MVARGVKCTFTLLQHRGGKPPGTGVEGLPPAVSNIGCKLPEPFLRGGQVVYAPQCFKAKVTLVTFGVVASVENMQVHHTRTSHEHMHTSHDICTLQQARCMHMRAYSCTSGSRPPGHLTGGL